jgi:hypothetical protein
MITNYGRLEVPTRQKSIAAAPSFGSGTVGVSLLSRPSLVSRVPGGNRFGAGIGRES